ncbi:hypothetical protein AVEN_253397-1 [Araneus ventricosus]|uniref:Uncharacterized protein n=1 Tax=Araneus ventricosus TaxID=182803 RepID=A0A4Y2L6V7_ARAVE|nr:hypothetical protein AVEN_253397-1 [Araneus ventricosus]
MWAKGAKSDIKWPNVLLLVVHNNHYSSCPTQGCKAAGDAEIWERGASSWVSSPPLGPRQKILEVQPVSEGLVLPHKRDVNIMA